MEFINGNYNYLCLQKRLALTQHVMFKSHRLQPQRQTYI